MGDIQRVNRLVLVLIVLMSPLSPYLGINSYFFPSKRGDNGKQECSAFKEVKEGDKSR